jgi:hypothetical protein
MYLEVETAQWINNIKGKMIIAQLIIFAQKVHTSKWNFESKNKGASAWSSIFWPETNHDLKPSLFSPLYNANFKQTEILHQLNTIFGPQYCIP